MEIKLKSAWDKLSMLEKALLIKLSLDNGVSSLKLIRDTYNLYANGGNLANKYDGELVELSLELNKLTIQLYTDLKNEFIANGGVYPYVYHVAPISDEIVVTPSKLDKLSLQLVRELIPEKETRKYLLELLDQRLTSAGYHTVPYNDAAERLADVYNASGQPKVYLRPSIRASLLGVFGLDGGTAANRAHMNPVTNTLYNIKSWDDFMAEIAHSYNEHNIKDLGYSGFFGSLSAYKNDRNSVYNRPYNLEFTTHTYTEPFLDSYIIPNSWKFSTLDEINDEINYFVNIDKGDYKYPKLENAWNAFKDIFNLHYSNKKSTGGPIYPFNNGDKLSHKKSGEELGESQKLPVVSTLWKIITNNLSEDEKDIIRTNLTKLTPYSYHRPITRFINTALKGEWDSNFVRYTSNLDPNRFPLRYALWSKALYDKDTHYKFGDYFKLSEYKPTLGSTDALYYSVKNRENFIPLLVELGSYTVGKGLDSSGKYYSIYDDWDINPFGKRTKNYGDILLNIKIYDRVYENDSTLYKYLEGRYNYNQKNKTSNGNVVVKIDTGSEMSTGGPLYPFSFEKNHFLKTPIVRYDDGGVLNNWEQGALDRATNIYSNYELAIDNKIPLWRIPLQKKLKQLGLKSGLSNCTLTATLWVDPTNSIMSAATIFNNPKTGYVEIDSKDAIPGNLLITKNPETGGYHTMMIEGFTNSGEPILRYSNGDHTADALRTNISLSEYHSRDNSLGGNHTENHYFRYNYPNEVFLPEITIFPKKKN